MIYLYVSYQIEINRKAFNLLVPSSLFIYYYVFCEQNQTNKIYKYHLAEVIGVVPKYIHPRQIFTLYLMPL